MDEKQLNILDRYGLPTALLAVFIYYVHQAGTFVAPLALQMGETSKSAAEASRAAVEISSGNRTKIEALSGDLNTAAGIARNDHAGILQAAKEARDEAKLARLAAERADAKLLNITRDLERR